MGIEKCATQRAAFDGRKSIADGAYGADDYDPGVLKRRDNVEGNEELILHNENRMCADHLVPSFAFGSSIAALCLGNVVRFKRAPLGYAFHLYKRTAVRESLAWYREWSMFGPDKCPPG